MKDPMEVLRFKEQELARVRKEIDALRIAARLLSDENNAPVADIRAELPKLVEMP